MRQNKWFFMMILAFIGCFLSSCKEETIAETGAVTAAGMLVLDMPLPPSTEPLQKPTPSMPEKVERHATLSAVGDLMVHTWQMTDAYRKETGEYDFSNDFELVKAYLDEADFRAANLETVFAGADVGYSDYPMFNTPDSFGAAIKEAGFDLVSTANNHTMDKRAAGALRTLNVLDTLGIDHVGTYRSAEERQNYYIKEINGIQVAFLAYTYGTNGITVPSDMGYLVNIMDEDLIKSDLQKVKALNPDLIVIMPHMGNEYETYPREIFKNWINMMVENGADIVLASHPHVLQPMEVRTHTEEDGSQRDVCIVYSLGNFISSQRTEPRDAGVIINIEVSKTDEERVVIEKVELIPTWVQFRNQAGQEFVRVIGVADALTQYENGIENELRAKDIARLKRVHSETTAVYFGEAVPLEQMQSKYTFYERQEQ